MKHRNNFLYDNGLSFDDVTLTPVYSDIRSRLHPDTTVLLGSEKHTTSLSVPIISSPMDTITGSEMAISLGQRGAMGIVHRFMSHSEQVGEIKNLVDYNMKTEDSYAPIAVAIGTGKKEKQRFRILYSEFKNDLNWIAIDVANGFSSIMSDMIDWVKNETHGDIPLLVGNVATGEGFSFLAEAGADAVRVGIGGGSICKTRIMTGFGVPTLASVADCYRVKLANKDSYGNTAIIADGGIRYPGDLVKSIGAGADAIIAGRIFAGTIETPGDVVNINGKEMKIYRGMASKEVQDDRKGGLRPGTCAEGVSTYVQIKGKAYYILEEFLGGLRSGMTYANAGTLQALRDNAKFIQITNAGLNESHAFGTKI